ncbi:hypothetical protein [Sphingobium herbicidovorans]|uniref:hypothetical protein n=1 Tax=Sphingobium herbicidovorans TaxID=76947 RepID=UPI001E4D66E5|nr:hypothetical protein [Sphingobium herbicidovorans]
MRPLVIAVALVAAATSPSALAQDQKPLSIRQTRTLTYPRPVSGGSRWIATM